MNHQRILLVCILILSCVSLASADFYYETEIKGQPGTDGPKVAKNYISDEGMRMEMGDGTGMIINFKEEVMYNINMNTKEYRSTKFADLMKTENEEDAKMAEQMGKMVEQMMASMQVTPTDETQEINGWKCKKYNVNIMGSTMEYWVTQDVKNYKELEKYMDKYKKVFEKNPMLKNISTAFEMQKKFDGFPIRNVSNMMGTEIVSTVTKVKDDKIDAKIFQVPEGYTEAAN